MNWREKAKAKAAHNLEKARDLVARCEADLGRKLSDGERRDLLTDNTKWSRELIVAAVAELAGVQA